MKMITNFINSLLGKKDYRKVAQDFISRNLSVFEYTGTEICIKNPDRFERIVQVELKSEASSAQMFGLAPALITPEDCLNVYRAEASAFLMKITDEMNSLADSPLHSRYYNLEEGIELLRDWGTLASAFVKKDYSGLI